METLEFSFASESAAGTHPPTLRGVVGSGNLEVLIVAAPGGEDCRMLVHTSARGFRDIWHAVLESFSGSNAVGKLSFVINDMGATPAVVTLRLSQALAAYMEDPHAREDAPLAAPRGGAIRARGGPSRENES
jgi:malonate decarboxylase delta subunit